jgi:hypothetical protein
MKAKFLAVAVVAAGAAGCATGYFPPRPSSEPGPAYNREIQEGRPGLFGDLRWNIDLSGKREPLRASDASAAEQEEFKKWRESMGPSERQEFEEWRAWQEWKRKNPK